MMLNGTVRAGTCSEAALRTGWLYGRAMIVVPVVAMLGDSIVWAQNADTPEFVPAEELGIAPQGWNGRPVVGNHPAEGGRQVSASSPATLAKCAFGTVFNARMDGRTLVMDAWIDPIRAKAVGRDAERVIERVQAGEMVEVSVGVFVVAVREDGRRNGQAYHGRWTSIMPDHLAMLPEGKPGACSIDAGCGAPRRVPA